MSNISDIRARFIEDLPDLPVCIADDFKDLFDHIDSVNQWQNTLEEYMEWSRTTFPKSTPASVVEHLRREVEELAKSPGDKGEIADCFMLIVDYAQRSNVDLLQAIKDKLAINRQRVWGQPDADGVVEHVRS